MSFRNQNQGLWNSYLFFSFTLLSATIFINLFSYSKVELWLLCFFLLVLSLVIYQRRSMGRRNMLINILKYYLATPVTSTGYLPYSPCLTSTLNVFWNHGPSVLISSPYSCSDNPYILPFPGEAMIPLMNNFLRYIINKKEFLCLRKLRGPQILKLSPNIIFFHLQTWIQEHLDEEGKV